MNIYALVSICILVVLFQIDLVRQCYPRVSVSIYVSVLISSDSMFENLV